MQRGGVDAITLACWWRPVGKNVTEVGITVAAEQFYPAHAVTVVSPLHDIGFLELRMKTRPPATGIEFALGTEQRMSATDTVVNTVLPVPFILAAERRFGAGHAGYTELFRRQRFAPFVNTFPGGHVVALQFKNPGLADYDPK